MRPVCRPSRLGTLLAAAWLSNPANAIAVSSEAAAAGQRPDALLLVQTRVEIRPPFEPGVDDQEHLASEEAELGGPGQHQKEGVLVLAEHAEARASAAVQLAIEESLAVVGFDLNITEVKDGLSRGDWKHWAVSNTVSWAIYMVLALLIWTCCYPTEPLQVLDAEDPMHTFQYSHFGCFRNPGICLCACCCPGLRWADTMRLAGLLPICTGLTVFFVAALLNGLMYSNVFIGLATCLLLLYYRQKLRGRLALHSCTAYTCCVDFIYVFLCPWCAIAQEARVVRHAYKAGTPGFEPA